MRSIILDIKDFKWLFVSEIKGIQDYIFGTDKLRHIIGASEIISSITGSKSYSEKEEAQPLYKSVLKALECIEEQDYIIMQAAAGRLILLFKEKKNIDKLMAIWGIILNEYAPGAELVYNSYEIKSPNLCTEKDNALKDMRLQRQQPSCSLPIPSLPVERCRRDGKAAVTVNPQDSREPISNEIYRKLEAAASSRQTLFKKFIPKRKGKIEQNFSHLEDETNWPVDFKDITDNNDKTYMAVMHIDVNRMGRFFQELANVLGHENSETFIEISLLASQKLLSAAQYAAQEATREILKVHPNTISKDNPMPLRPLVLAGDDLTVVIKAPYAIPFAKRYMKEFSNNAQLELRKLVKTKHINIREELTRLTLSAGITYTKANFPFKSAYNLCEELCKLGKKQSNRECSTISFYRQTTSTCDELESLLEREFTHTYNNIQLKLSYETYALSPNTCNLPQITDLENMVTAFSKLPKGVLRKMATKLFDSKEIVDSAWNRFVDICSSRNSNSLEQLQASMENITHNHNEPLWENLINQTYKTPLIDAINLHSVVSAYYAD